MTPSDPTSRVSPWPHRWAVLLCCATFPLIWVGGLVTTYDAGMAVPDWPNTYGYNLFLYPWQSWITGPFDLFIEHGHRLLGALVGMMTIAFVLAVFLARERPWMKIVSVVALLAVIGQGALGGARVLFDDRQLAMIHGCCGPAFFALTVAMAAFTSRFWTIASAVPDALNERLVRLGIFTAVLAYVQLVLGAAIRHVPIDATAAYFRGMVLFHLVMAVAVLVHAVLLSRAAWRYSGNLGMRAPATTLCGLVCVQVLLGAATWVVKYGWPAWLADTSWAAGYVIQTKSFSQALTITAHVANGSLILGIAVLMAVRAARVAGIVGELRAQRAANYFGDDQRSAALALGQHR